MVGAKPVGMQPAQPLQRVHRRQRRLGLLEEAADSLLSQAAELLILAHQRCQKAHGVNRAVGMARRGETWTPYSATDTSDWLAEVGRADQARKAARTA